MDRTINRRDVVAALAGGTAANAAVLVSADLEATATPPASVPAGRVWLPFAVQRRAR